MPQLIINPEKGGQVISEALPEDLIAYYKFEETEDLSIAIDSKMNFNGTTPATHNNVSSRVEGKVGQGLLCKKNSTVDNFMVNKVLDEIPVSLKFTVSFWIKLLEDIRKGEHRSYAIFSKQWTTGMKLWAYVISRLETIQLHICFEYTDTEGIKRTERAEYTIPQGIIQKDVWQKIYIELWLLENWYSKFGIYWGDWKAYKDTDYFVDIPRNTNLSPDIIGGDETNLRIATNDNTIPIIVDNLPFASSDRYGLDCIIDEVMIFSTLKKPLYGTLPPRLYLTVSGDGTVDINPDKEEYTEDENVTLTATANEGATFKRWIVYTGATVKSINGQDITVNEDLVDDIIPVLSGGSGNWKVRFTSGALKDSYFDISDTQNVDEGDILTLVGDLTGLAVGDEFEVVNTDNPATIKMCYDRYITAVFTGAYTLTVNIVGNGSVNINPNKEGYSSGETVELTAIADDGNYFYAWSGDISSKDNPVSFTITGDMVITCTFIEKTENCYITYKSPSEEGQEGITNINDNNYITGEGTGI